MTIEDASRNPSNSFGWCLVCLLAFLSRSFGYQTTISGIGVHKVPLRQHDDSSPYCYAASSSLDLMKADSPINFLASQVWPSARVAAFFLEQHMDPTWIVVEFGCGPGLPALAAAKLGAPHVYATDLEDFALDLVEFSSKEQGLSHRLSTRRLDLTANFEGTNIPQANLYIFSDVFESKHVALGAAAISNSILSQYDDTRVWVFAQSDRACREDYLTAMRQHTNDPSLAWTSLELYDLSKHERLFLCDLEETKVSY